MIYNSTLSSKQFNISILYFQMACHGSMISLLLLLKVHGKDSDVYTYSKYEIDDLGNLFSVVVAQRIATRSFATEIGIMTRRYAPGSRGRVISEITGRGCLETLISTRWRCCHHCSLLYAIVSIWCDVCTLFHVLLLSKFA